ncbi:MAG: decarboxylating 6-phosphogluconate dehydrogenase [Candidatus Doudnabacteria bacterium]|nr:decarboxylating 6-phosphogluconate dehydrogenase [Candidatus Doudnabacteria bacterium]
MKKTIAVFGLGKMGMQIAKRLSKNGFEVLAWNRSEGPRKEIGDFFSGTNDKSKVKSKAYSSIDDLVGDMGEGPRVFWIMLPHELVKDFIFNKSLLGGLLKKGDVVIDGGNSFYKDSIQTAKELKQKGIAFYDCGTSGGVWGEKNGFALMVGGEKEKWKEVDGVFKALSAGENFGLVGKNGAGHFVKMVHNGIEYGMMEAIAEGYGIMKASKLDLDLLQVTKIYQQGTVIRSWLIDLTRNIFEQEDIEGTKGQIAMLGEGEWTVEAAKELGIDARVIEDSVNVRKESVEEKNQQKFSNKIVALLRKQFGGHGVKK